MADVRQKFLERISKSRPITRKIILIGPDHFSSDQRQININNQDWNLSTGYLKFQDLNLNLPINNDLLKNDHAIYNPLADIKTYFPQAVIYPILIGQKVSFSELDSLLNKIVPLCNSDCLLIASVDFSHYQPATLAEAHDSHTLRVLNNFETKNISNLEVDSPQSLYLLTKFSELKSAKKFNLFAHTNSGFITGSPDIETTSHIFAYYTSGVSPKINTTTTVSAPKLFDRHQNQNTLGDRFFYGVDNFTIDSTLNFVVSTVSSDNQIIKSYLPIKNNIFIRGPEKQTLIKKYFDSIPDEQNLTKDYFWGRLIYDQKNNSQP